jgi:hypothetical protein
MMSDKRMMTVAVCLLLAIFTVLVIQTSRTSKPDTVGGSINEVVEEIGDEIDDHTTAR